MHEKLKQNKEHRKECKEMFTYGFQLNKDEFGMKASNGVTYRFSFRKYPNVDYPMAYYPEDDSIVFFLFKEIGNREFELHVLFALNEEHTHRVLTRFGIPFKIQDDICVSMLSQLSLLAIENGKIDEWLKEWGFFDP